MRSLMSVAVLFTFSSLLCIAAPPDGKGKPKTDESGLSFQDPLTAFNTSRWQAADGWANGTPFLNAWSASALGFTHEGLSIHLTDTPLLGYNYTSGELRTSQFYGYGCYSVEMKPAAIDGVVTAFFTFAGPFDRSPNGNGQHNEIDIEFLGYNTEIVQFNFWTNDDQYINGHEAIIELGFDASQSFNHYGFKWTENGIDWYINRKLVYSVVNSPGDPTPVPTDGMHKIMLNLWPVDNSAANWAGQFIYPMRPITGQFKNVSFELGSDCHFDEDVPPPPSPEPTLHLSELEVSLNSKQTQAVATVKITDENGAPANNVQVLGEWSGVISDGDGSKATDATGEALFYSRRSRASSGNYQFCVTSLSKDEQLVTLESNHCDSVPIP